MQTTLVPGPSAPRRSDGVASVFIIVGGTFQSVAAYPEAASSDVVCYLDVSSEVDGVSTDASVATLRLAAGETLGNLVETYGSEALKRDLKERPGISLQVGCGRVRAIGKVVADQLRASPEFMEFLRKEIILPLMIKHQGRLLHVTVYVDTSFAGGTGSAGAEIIAEAISKLILELSGAQVRLAFRRVGSLTFIQLGDRVHENTAATLAEDIEFMQSADRDHREVRCLEVVELPMVGPQKEQRDNFVMAYLQAMCAPSVRSWLDRTSPNEALNSRFGNIRVVQACFGRSLSDRQVAAEVAGPFAAVIESVINAPPAPGVGDEFKVITREVPAQNLVPVQELGNMIQSAKGIRGPDLWAQCTRVPVEYHSEGILTNDKQHQRIPLRKRIIGECRTIAEWQDKVASLKALHRGLRRDLEMREEPLQEARHAVTEAEKHLESVWLRLFPKTRWNYVCAIFCDRAIELVKLLNAISDHREKTRVQAKLECEHAALGDAEIAVSEELAAEGKRLRHTLDLLQAVGSRSGQSPLLRPKSLDSILGELVQEAGKQHAELPERVYRLLASCAGTVTLAGLAAIVDSPEARPATIAYQLTHEPPCTQGPFWGGKRYLGPVQKLLVLPPMPGDVFEDVRELVLQHDPSLIVAMAETARGVVNAVFLEIFSPKLVSDILTPLYRQYLRKAMEQPHLFFTKEVHPERWLEDLPSKNGRRSEACAK